MRVRYESRQAEKLVAISGHLIRKAGLSRASVVTLIQRFGSAPDLNNRFDMLVPDGVYRRVLDRRLEFVSVAAPSPDELTAMIRTIAELIGRSL